MCIIVVKLGRVDYCCEIELGIIVMKLGHVLCSNVGPCIIVVKFVRVLLL